MDIIEYNVKTRKVLNERQCLDFSSKLSKTVRNIRGLVLSCGSSDAYFRDALEGLYRHLEKAKLLVNQCGESDWCVASVFQGHNENSFREILLDVAMFYNAIVEKAKSMRRYWLVDFLEDLRQSSVFLPATTEDVQEDQQELRRRLESLASDPSTIVKPWIYFLRERESRNQVLARYLLAKLSCTSQESRVSDSFRRVQCHLVGKGD